MPETSLISASHIWPGLSRCEISRSHPLGHLIPWASPHLSPACGPCVIPTTNAAQAFDLADDDDVGFARKATVEEYLSKLADVHPIVQDPNLIPAPPSLSLIRSNPKLTMQADLVLPSHQNQYTATRI